MRILHAIGGGDWGGATSYLLPILSALEREGNDVHLLCLGGGSLAEKARDRGLKVNLLPMRDAWDPSILGPLRRVLSGRVPGSGAGVGRWDVVHTHGMRANLPVRLVSMGLKHRPCLFTTVHSDLRLDYSSRWPARLYPLMDRATLSSVDEIVCASDGLRAVLIERGYPAARLTTVYPGLEAPPVDASPAEASADSAARQAGPRVGTAARLVPVKDLPLLLEVAGVLRRTLPESEVLIIGDGPERERLGALAVSLGLEGMVRFAGRVEEVQPLLAGLDIYTVTSVFEGGVPMSVLEAMSAGLPVVATAVGGITEGVVEGTTGYLVSRNQPRDALVGALAERIAALWDDAALRARMGAAGARRVREEFTVERAAARTLRLYERCLAAQVR